MGEMVKALPLQICKIAAPLLIRHRTLLGPDGPVVSSYAGNASTDFGRARLRPTTARTSQSGQCIAWRGPLVDAVVVRHHRYCRVPARPTFRRSLLVRRNGITTCRGHRL